MLGFTAFFHLALRSRGGSSSSSSFPSSSSFFLLNISLNPDFLIFIMQFDLQPVDLAVVKKQKSIQFLFCSQAANNKAWETFFWLTIIPNQLFPYAGWQKQGGSWGSLDCQSKEGSGANGALGYISLLGWAAFLFLLLLSLSVCLLWS